MITVVNSKEERFSTRTKLLQQAGYRVVYAESNEEACRMASQERPAMLLLKDQDDERFRILADSAPALMWMNGPDGCEFVNRAYLDFLGVHDVDVRGFDWAQFVHPHDRKAYVTAYLEAVVDRRLFEATFRFLRHNGEYRWMKSVGTPRFSEDGTYVGYVGSTIDVTDLHTKVDEVTEPMGGHTSLASAREDGLREEIEAPKKAEDALRESEARSASEALARDKLNQLSSRLWRTASLPESLAEMLAGTIEMLGADMGTMQMLDAERGVLTIEAQRGFERDFLEFFREVSTTDDSACGRALRSAERIVIEDVETDEPYAPMREIARAAGYRAVQFTPLIARDGKPLGMLSTHWRLAYRSSDKDFSWLDLYVRQATDFIERCQIEHSLRESKQEIQRARHYAENILRTSPVPLLVLDDEYRVTDANAAYCETFQVRVPETEGRLLYDLGNGQWNVPKLRHLLEDILPQHRWFNDFEVTHDFESIGRRTMLLNARRMEDELDSPARIVLVIEDVTKGKQAEERLRHFSVELEQRVLERTEELLSSQERLRALSTKLNLTEQRERSRLATELHDHLQQMLVLGKLTITQGKRFAVGNPACKKMIRKLDDLLSDALKYTRSLVAELSPPVLREHGLVAGIKWLCEYMKKYDVTVTITVPEPVMMLSEDQVLLLFQSVRELLINSSKYAGTGKATVAMAHENGQLHIDVCDQGTGFDPAVANTPNVEGVSCKFGLFSIRERMKSLGGSFEIESAPGKGTRARLTLLLKSGELGVASGQQIRPGSISSLSEAHPQLPTGHTLTTIQSTRIRVLLVDDHTMVRQGLRSVLDGYAEIELVGEAGDGEEAVSLVHRLRPSVVIMDINMPKKNGIEATAEIKAHYPDIAVIGLSVNAGSAHQEAMKRAGGLMILKKEAAVPHLYEAIQKALNRNG